MRNRQRSRPGVIGRAESGSHIPSAPFLPAQIHPGSVQVDEAPGHRPKRSGHGSLSFAGGSEAIGVAAFGGRRSPSGNALGSRSSLQAGLAGGQVAQVPPSGDEGDRIGTATTAGRLALAAGPELCEGL